MSVPDNAPEAQLSKVIADLFQGRERWYLAGALAMSLVTAVFETVGVVSILPFMALVLDPSAIQRFHALHTIAQALGVESQRGALLLLGAATIGVVALGNAISAINVLVQQRFTAHTQTRISTTLLRGYLAQPYSFHVEHDAPALLKVLGVDVGVVMGGVITPFMLGMSRLLTAIGVLAILFFQNPMASVLVGVAFAMLYMPVYRVVRARQRTLGIISNAAILERQRVSHETLGGVKELQVLGRERYAAERFEAAAHAATHAAASNTATSQIPRNFLETIAFGGILLVTMALVANGNQRAKDLVPLLALYAFAGYRLMPALQQVFASAVEIRFRLPSLVALYDDYALGAEAERDWNQPDTAEPRQVPFISGLTFRHVTLAYPAATAPAVRDVSLTLRPNESVGIIGTTGAGKTSLAELALGIHVPTRGTITVDDQPLTGATVRAWRRTVGYVPQRVFLSNTSVAENIAFGLRPSEIDHEAVERAACIAQASAFISDLPRGFDTMVGERGVKLSGGQIQRIGVARALYHDPRVLVFDEATSALDLRTEHALMEALRSREGNRTLILIAHRLRSVEWCDRVVMMQEGAVIADGSYQTLLKTSPAFRHFVGRPEFAAVATATG